MKKTVLIVAISFMVSGICFAQEWFTSFDVAKRLALVQNKMLFVMWDGSFDYQFPVILFDEKGIATVVDLTKNELIEELIWKYFVPLKLPEYEYAKFSDHVKETRGIDYYNKLIDDNIKIMDINGNILNVDDSLDKYYFIDDFGYLVINDFIKRFALNTSFLKQELEGYNIEKNFATAYRLASKYVDYAIFVEKEQRELILDLANIYFDEAKGFLKEGDENYMVFLQKLDLEQVKEQLILNKPRKALRMIKRTDSVPTDPINERLFAFLNYTAYKLLNDEKKALPYVSKLSALDLKKTELILNINR